MEMYVAQPLAQPSYAGNAVFVNGDDHKFVLGHEIGHVLGEMIDGDYPERDQTIALDGCATTEGNQNGHEMNSREYTASASMEGWANYYSSVLWNETDETDCEFSYWASIDWDLDGTNDITTPDDTFVCIGDPCLPGDCASPGFLNSTDWLADLDAAADTVTDCGDVVNVTDNASTEYDFMRMYWGLIVNQGVPRNVLFELYNDADPKTFDPNLGTGGTSDDPWSRFATSASTNSISTEWGAEAAAQGTAR